MSTYKLTETDEGREAYMRAIGRSGMRAKVPASRSDRVVPLELFVALLRSDRPMTMAEMYLAVGRSSGYRSYEAVHVLEEYGLIERVGKRAVVGSGKEATLFRARIGEAGEPLARRRS